MALILDEACSDGRTGRTIERVWAKDYCNPQIQVIPFLIITLYSMSLICCYSFSATYMGQMP